MAEVELYNVDLQSDEKSDKTLSSIILVTISCGASGGDDQRTEESHRESDSNWSFNWSPADHRGAGALQEVS